MAEHDVVALDALEDGALVKAQAGERDVLLVRRGERVHALAHACSHLKLPLSKGYLDGDRLYCAFHHAAFDIETGAQLEPPGCRGIARYATRIADGRVFVTIDPGQEEHPLPAMATQGADARHFVILGAGAAGDAAALSLRANGFEGRVTVVTQEDARPYDRTLLSKAALKNAAMPDGLPLDEAETYANHAIAFETGRRVTRIDAAKREIGFATGETLAYDAALIALGGEARSLGAPGEDLPGVHALRSERDAKAILSDLPAAKRVVLVGGGFIGLEAAVALVSRDGLEVTLAMPHDVPLAHVVGERIGRVLKREIEEAAVTFRTGAEVTGFEGDGRLERVRLKDGSALDADLALVAVGIKPAPGAVDGLETQENGAVKVGADMTVADTPGLWAAGDAALFPSRWGEVRIEHWRLARQLGDVAARAMLGQPAEYEDVPFFWSALTRQLRYAGHAEDWDEIVYDGAPEDGPFLAAYVKDRRIMAVLGAGRDADVARLEARMRREGPLRASLADALAG